MIIDLRCISQGLLFRVHLYHCVKPSYFTIGGLLCDKVFILLSVPNQGQDRDGICRSWGQHHFETFDGNYFYFPGTCSYVLAQDCHSTMPQYTVWVRAVRSSSPSEILNNSRKSLLWDLHYKIV